MLNGLEFVSYLIEARRLSNATHLMTVLSWFQKSGWEGRTTTRFYLSQSTPSTQTVRVTAELRHGDERDTVRLFSRTAEGRRTRQRAVRGELTPEEIAEIPEIFHPLLQHLQSSVSSLTGETVVPSDYIHMAQADGTPNRVTFDDLRRKLGGIAKVTLVTGLICMRQCRTCGLLTCSHCSTSFSTVE